METLKKERYLYGSITVFLSLTLLLILSLLMTIIEGARHHTARVIAERSLTLAMDSVLAEFYGPFMDEYHLLGLDSSYGEPICSDYEITRRIEEYMSYTLTPKLGLESNVNPVELFGISIESLKLNSKTGLMDYGGDIFIHEITEYMKYKELGDIAEFFLNKASILEQPKKLSILYEEKIKVEEEILAIDEGVLALMKYIDGLSTNKKGLVRSKNTGLKIESFFAKKIMFETPTMESTGINNERVFYALEKYYSNPSKLFVTVDKEFQKLSEISTYLEDLEKSLQKIQGEKEENTYLLKQLTKNMDDRDDLEADILNLENKISELERFADDIEANMADYNKELIVCTETITKKVNELNKLISGCITAVKQAILQLEQILITIEKAQPLILSYEKNLENKKEELSKDIYESLQEGLEELKKYQKDIGTGYNFPLMKDILEKNYEILLKSERNLDQAYKKLSDKDFDGAKSIYSNTYRILQEYQTKNLNLDYSSLVTYKDKTPDFIGQFKKLLEEGICALVVDYETMSSKELGNFGELPSKTAGLSKEDDQFSFLTLLNKLNLGGKNSGLDSFFQSFGDYSIDSLLKEAIDNIAKRFLLIEYINQHFYRFPCENESKETKKPSVLTYEKEYLLFGKLKDKDNLEDIIKKIILIRTLLNFTSILTDKEKWQEAKTIAATLVGFMGLPILVTITQSILMFLLAFGSGLIDTSALLMGKEIPILKKRVDLKFAELLLLNKEYIEKKAASYKEEKGFSYNDYLTLFLYFTDLDKLSFRMMDLMQENINLRYGSNFRISNCIFGFETEAVFHIKPIFTSLSFLKKILKSDFNQIYIVQGDYSY